MFPRNLASLVSPCHARPGREVALQLLQARSKAWRGWELPRNSSRDRWNTTSAGPPITPPVVSPATASSSSTSAHQEQETGHFKVRPNESLFFFENIFPKRLSALLRYPAETDADMTALLRRFYNSSGTGSLDPITLVKRAIPSDMPLKVTEILPRLKDGGAFVKVQFDASVSPSDIESILLEKLKQRPLRPWFSPFRGIKARLVKGTPWLEDLYRYPSSLVKVEFVPSEPGASAEELSEETLYSMFRRYGKIADIEPQPFDSKVIPKFSRISFSRLSDAIMARNCMHGFIVKESLGGGKSGTILRLSYIRRVKAHNIWDWLTSHPRIVIPILAALLAGVSVIVFDPIRTFFIKGHVSHSFRFKESRFYRWFKSQTDNFPFRKSEHSDGLNTVWNHRRDLIVQLRRWLGGNSDTFIVITGPRGSGKIEMVMDQALSGRQNVLLVDCKPIADASGEAGTIKRLAAAVGYRPVFSWANSMSSMVDLAVQSTTGVKAGFSETLDSQVNKILHTTTNALKEIGLSFRSKYDKDAQLSEDAYLEAHPETRPVIVIDGFLHKNEEMTVVYEKIADWAATLVQNNIAHVIILTSDGAFSKPLSKALPDRVFRTVSLEDLDREVAKKFVTSRLTEVGAGTLPGEDNTDRNKGMDLTGLEECIETLGGRLTDLEFLSRRIAAGQTPRQAVDEIVNETAADIIRIFLMGKITNTDKRWSSEQAWYLIKALSRSTSLRYNQVLLAPAFASSTSPNAGDGEAALEALASTELISLGMHQGRPNYITAGKPLHQAAFSALVRDRVLQAKMDMAISKEMTKVETKTIDSVEAELTLLGKLPKQTTETAARVTYLLHKLNDSHGKIEELEKQMAVSKKVLNEED